MRIFDVTRPFSRGYGLLRGRTYLPSIVANLARDGRPGMAVVPYPAMTWADAARTTPATLGGQVELVDSLVPGWPPLVVADISHRPTYVTFPTPSGALAYALSFDGLDDRMSSAAAIDFSGQSRLSIVAGLRKRSDTDGFVAAAHGGVAPGRVSIVKDPTFDRWTGRFFGPLANVNVLARPAPDAAVIGYSVDRAAGTHDIEYNGAPATSAALASPAPFQNGAIRIGAEATGASPFPGEVFGIVAMPMTAAERAAITAALAVNTPVEIAP